MSEKRKFNPLDYRPSINEVRLNAAVKYFLNEKEKHLDRINPKDFIDEKNPNFTTEQIIKDLEYVVEMKKKFKQEDTPESIKNKQFSEAFEYVVSYFGESFNWFGENVYLVQTTDFDDIANSTDILAIYENEDEKGNPVFDKMLIDITTNTTDVLTDKIQRNIKRIILPTKSAKIKYFENVKTGFKGEIKNLVPIILGLDKTNASYLILDCLDMVEGKKTKEQIKDHPFSIIFLEELKMQLEFYQEILDPRKNDPDSNEYLKETKNIYLAASELIAQKKDIYEDKSIKDLLEADRLFTSLKKNLAKYYRKK